MNDPIRIESALRNFKFSQTSEHNTTFVINRRSKRFLDKKLTFTPLEPEGASASASANAAASSSWVKPVPIKNSGFIVPRGVNVHAKKADQHPVEQEVRF